MVTMLMMGVSSVHQEQDNNLDPLLLRVILWGVALILLIVPFSSPKMVLD